MREFFVMLYVGTNEKVKSMNVLTFNNLLELESKEVDAFTKKTEQYESSVDVYLKVMFSTTTIANLLKKSANNEEIIELTEDYFIKNFYQIKISKDHFFGAIGVYKNYEYKQYNPENKTEYKEKHLESYLNEMHEKFMQVTKWLLDYRYKNEDFALQFKYNNNKAEFVKLFIMFKNNILTKFIDLEYFKNTFREKLRKELEDVFEQKIVVGDVFETGKIYTVSKTHAIEKVIETGRLPEVKTWYYNNMEVVDRNTISFYFSCYLDSNPLFSRKSSGYNVIRIDASKNRQSIYIEKDNMFVFLNKKDAENFYKSQLLKMREKIDKALNLQFEF